MCDGSVTLAGLLEVTFLPEGQYANMDVFDLVTGGADNTWNTTNLATTAIGVPPNFTATFDKNAGTPDTRKITLTLTN